MNTRCLNLLFVVVALTANHLVAMPPVGEYMFEWLEGGCWLEANKAPVNDMLAEVSEVTGIPIYVDPSDKSTMTVVLEDRDLETLIKAVASGSSITYAEDPETGEYYIESILTTTSVDSVAKAKRSRARVVSEKNLKQKMPVDLGRPVKYSGIGARVLLAADKKGVWLRPLSVKSAAHKAGIEVGDLVTAIDGKPVVEFANLRELVEAIRGPEGTTVALRITTPDGTDTVKYVRREVFDYRPPARR